MPKMWPVEDAMSKYRLIRHSFVDLVDIDNTLLTSADPWSALRGEIGKCLEQCKRRGKQYQKLRDCLFYIQQAEEFALAAINVRLPTKATLTYYSMMSLAKALLTHRGIGTGSHHGLTYDNGRIKYIHHDQSTFKGLVESLGGNYSKGASFDFKSIVKNVLEVHMLYSQMYSGDRQTYLPVEIKYKVARDPYSTKMRLFTELCVKKRDEAEFKFKKKLNFLKNSFKRPSEEGEFVTYESVLRKTCTPKNFDSVIRTTMSDYKRFPISQLLVAHHGYKYYLDLKQNELSHLCYSYLLMFYVGSVARYWPKDAAELMKGQSYALINEAVRICPRQFLYQISSFILGKLLVIPDSCLEN